MVLAIPAYAWSIPFGPWITGLLAIANKPDPKPSKLSKPISRDVKGGSESEGEAGSEPEEAPKKAPQESGDKQPEPEPEDSETEDVRAIVRGLVSKTKKGDRDAYRQLVERYQKRVFGILFGMLHSREDAMELAQDVFIRVYQRIGEFEEKSSFYTWVYRIAVNLAIDFRRREWKKVHTEYDDSVSDQGADDAVFQRDRTTPEQAAQSKELGEAINRALETLPDEQRAVLMMRELDGLSYQEMADSMGCSIGTIMSRLFYARKKMQAALKGLEVKK